MDVVRDRDSNTNGDLCGWKEASMHEFFVSSKAVRPGTFLNGKSVCVVPIFPRRYGRDVEMQVSELRADVMESVERRFEGSEGLSEVLRQMDK